MSVLNTVKHFDWKRKYNHLNHYRWFYTNHYKLLLKRKEIIATYIKEHKVRKIQFGCGEFVIKDWLNTEIYGGIHRLPLNLLKPFPIPSRTFDYAFSEHTIEHFTYEQGQRIMNESYRILRKGGKVRVTTPDLLFLIRLYGKNKTKLQKEYIRWAADVNFHDTSKRAEGFIINNFVRAWGHHFIYDRTTITQLLKESGFRNIQFFKPGVSKDKNLQNIEMHWKAFNKRFNNLESLCVEATK